MIRLTEKPKYDHQAYLRYRSEFVFDILKSHARTSFESIADFGCGDGMLLTRIMERVGATRGLGLDFNAKESLSTDSVEIRKGNILKHKVVDRFELIISNQVFEHIYEPWLPDYFGVLKDSCAPHGVVLISTPNRWRPKNILRRLAAAEPEMMNPNPGIPPEEHLGHHRECSYSEMLEIANDYFPEAEWTTTVARTAPREIGGFARHLVNIGVYYGLWPFWRLLCHSASHDHYLVATRRT